MNPEQLPETEEPTTQIQTSDTAEHEAGARLNASPGLPSDEGSASHYIAAELQRTRIALRKTKIVGLVLLLLVGGEMAYITARFTNSFQPHTAAEIADGFVAEQINDKGPDFVAALKQKVPEFIEQTPDYALHALPTYRQSLEDKLDTQMTQYAQSSSQQLGQHIDTFLDQNKNEIKQMLASGNDPTVMHQLGISLKQQLTAYLKEKPMSGESIGDQLKMSLASLQEVQKTTHRLATAKHLTPTEQKARRAIAIMSQSVDQARNQIQQAL
jgi:hypothetical protein